MSKTSETRKLFLVDAMNLVFRAFFAPMQMSLVSPAGVPTKAVYIFLRTLRKLVKDYQPDLIAVAFDLAAPTFRDKLFEQYKAERPEFPEDLSVQLPYVRQFCEALRIPIVEKEGFEADDVMGTLAKGAAAKGILSLIVTGDQDLFQLVTNDTFVVKPARGSNDSETLYVPETPDEIVAAAVRTSGLAAESAKAKCGTRITVRTSHLVRS
jgi:DNA polymerase-1